MKYQTLKRLINKLPYVRTIHRENFELKRNSNFPSGHFYSPVVSIDEIELRESNIWAANQQPVLEGIDLNIKEQKSLLEKFSKYYVEIPFTAEPINYLRYFFENSFYSYTDGIVLYSVIRHFKPKNIIEIGSGFSSALMLDVNEIFFQNSMALTFIEPYPNRLQRLLKDKDKGNCRVLKQKVQNVDIEEFRNLNDGDILFIDSSHVVKTDSDVHHIVFNILPILKKGVLIHFHDIFFPFEYPKKWVLNGYNWNEAYFLRAFLMHNEQYEILLFSDFMHRFHREEFSNMPLTFKNTGGNLWIRKN